MSILSPINPDRFQFWKDLSFSPAAGDPYHRTTFTADTHQLINLTCSFQTDANAANRMLYLSNTSAGRLAYFAPALRVQTASKTALYTFSRGAAPTQYDDSLMFSGSLPEDIFFIPGDILSINVINIQVGDAITAINTYWKTFPTG